MAGFNDSDGLRAFDRREAFQKIFNGFAAFQSVNQILQRNPRAEKNGRAAHDFGIGVNDAFQIFRCHNMATIPLTAKLSHANRDVVRFNGAEVAASMRSKSAPWMQKNPCRSLSTAGS